MSANVSAVLYLVSAVLFILALRGLSSPVTSRQGNLFGMAGMAIAILTTLVSIPPSFSAYALIVVGLAIGGAVGAVITRRIAMTAMPQLVAAFHSLVGLAAVMVAAAALYAPTAFGIGGSCAHICVLPFDGAAGSLTCYRCARGKRAWLAYSSSLIVGDLDVNQIEITAVGDDVFPSDRHAYLYIRTRWVVSSNVISRLLYVDIRQLDVLNPGDKGVSSA